MVFMRFGESGTYESRTRTKDRWEARCRMGLRELLHGLLPAELYPRVKTRELRELVQYRKKSLLENAYAELN